MRNLATKDPAPEYTPLSRYPEPDQAFMAQKDHIREEEAAIEGLQVEKVRQQKDLDALGKKLEALASSTQFNIRQLATSNTSRRKVLNAELDLIRSQQKEANETFQHVQDIIDSCSQQIDEHHNTLAELSAQRHVALRRYATQILAAEGPELERQAALALQRVLALRTVAGQSLKLNVWAKERINLVEVDHQVREIHQHIQEKANG